MSRFLLFVSIVALLSNGLDTAEAADRTAAAIRREVHDALRSHATAPPADQESAVRDLVALYREVDASNQFSDRSKKQLTGLIRNRLKRVQAALQKDIETESQPANRSPLGLAADGTNSPAEEAILAQIPGNLVGQNAQAARAGKNLAIAPAAQPANGKRANSFAAATTQNAQELVDLIQTTIAPKTWQANGGLGTIMYFAPAQVLVIRQTDGVHARVGNAIQNLRGQNP